MITLKQAVCKYLLLADDCKTFLASKKKSRTHVKLAKKKKKECNKLQSKDVYKCVNLFRCGANILNYKNLLPHRSRG